MSDRNVRPDTLRGDGPSLAKLASGDGGVLAKNLAIDTPEGTLRVSVESGRLRLVTTDE